MPVEYPISKYKKIRKKTDLPQENEIRVRVKSPPFAYAAYAGNLLLRKNMDFVYLHATGSAVSNSIRVVEFLKKNVKSKIFGKYYTLSGVRCRSLTDLKIFEFIDDRVLVFDMIFNFRFAYLLQNF